MKLPSFLSPEQAAALQAQLPLLSQREKAELFELLEEREKRARLTAAKDSVRGFAHAVYPGFKEGAHHRVLSRLFGDIIAGRKKRVIINIAPRMGKSEFSSYLLPAFYFGKFPDKKVIMGTHTASLSEDFGRRVRNLVVSDEYAQIFGATSVADDQKGSGKWSTSAGGQYYAVGVGGSIAGRGADLFIIDDPHSEQDMKSGSKLPFETAWNWFQTGPLQRLMPNGAIVVIMCMTGDTPVLMADNTERSLRDIRPGDTVATYDNGQIATTRVLQHRSNGVDAVFTVKTRSGRIVRANERHPFLVEADGERRWTRLKDLRPGQSLVALKDARAPHAPRPAPGCATPAKRAPRTTASTPTRRTRPWGITASCEALLAWIAAPLRPKSRAFARSATARPTSLPSALPHKRALRASSTATASLLSSTSAWLRNAAIDAMSAGSLLLQRTLALTGTASFASITATTPSGSGGFFATTAILPSDTGKPPKSCGSPLSTCSVTTDEIVSIEPAGHEEVFDVQIERTENFIANGLVSHNTRWSKIDLTGMILKHQAQNPDADQWEVVELPAILHENSDKEKSLWPEQWPLDQLQAKRAGMDPRFWQAQYMQSPTSEIAAIIKRDQWQIWPHEKPPKVDYIIESWDTAHETKNTSNYSACTTWGVWFNENDNDNAHIILLDAIRGRWAFPDLKKRALEHYKEWEPDCCLIEKKAAGAPLIQELRAMGIPISETSPSRAKLGASNDKIVRLNAIADMFTSGRVWAPDTRWAREVIEEVASFPSGDNDDYTDTMTQALQRMRNGGFIRLDSDVKDEPRSFRSVRRGAYY